MTAYGMKESDYVLLFMPIEGAFRLAVESDPELMFVASKKNIMLIVLPLKGY